MLTKANTRIIFVMALAALLVLVTLNVMQESEGVSSSYNEMKRMSFMWEQNSSGEVNFFAVGSGISNYTWYFGDGSVGYGKDVKHIYGSDKNYTVTVVMNKGGDDIMVSQYLNLMDDGTPTVDFYWAPETPTTSDTVQFWDNSTDPDNDIYNWTWDFGDGTISHEQNPTHSYAKGGKYDVMLFVKDHSSGGNGVTKQIIVFNVPPVANFYWTRDNSSIKFLDYSHDSDGSIANWTWNFGDGNVSYEQNPSHNYSYFGTYDVTLTVEDDDSAVDSVTRKVNTLNQIPHVTFFWAPLQPTVLDTVQFDDESSGVDDELVNWTWDFGDGNVSYEQNPSHQYSEKKTYTVTLTVIDERYALNTLSKDITIVNAPPVVNFSYEPAYPADGEMINFTDNSYDADGSVVNWTWDFGDGNVSYDRNATHNFSHSGTYTVNLTVRDNDGASSSMIRNITIANIYVDDDAPPEWYDERHVRTIQEGIDNASDGYHIYVLEGNYRENVIINKFVIMEGKNAVVDGTGSGNAVTVASDHTEIRGFILTNASNGAGIDVTGNNVTVENCIFTDSKTGLYLQGDNTTAANNEIRENIKGIIVDGSFNYINNNEIIHNSNGTDMTGNGNNIVSNNFTNNIFAVEMKNGVGNWINNNRFYGNSYAVDARAACNISGNWMYANGNGIRLFSSHTYADNNTVTQSTVAILVLGDENEIRNCDISQNGNGVEIDSSRHITVDSCSFSGNTYGMYIDGGDYVTVNNSEMDSHYTDGIYMQDSQHIEITNCSFSGNAEGMNAMNSGVNVKYCGFAGGDIGVNVTDSKLHIENSSIHGKDVGIEVYGNDTSMEFTDIYGNNFGLKVHGVNNTVEMCNVNDNNYGIYASSSISVMNSSVFENGYGVYLHNSSSCILENISVSNNTFGAYLYHSYDNTLSNCTFSGNEKSIILIGSTDNTVENNMVNNGTTGIELASSRHNVLFNNEIDDNNIGMMVSYSPNNIFKDNAMTGNKYGIDMEGSDIGHFYEQMDVSNDVNGAEIKYLVNRSDISLNGEFGYLALVNCENVTVGGSTESNGEGMLMVNSTAFTVNGGNFSDNIDGMVFILSSNGSINNTRTSDNADDGMVFRLSFDISVGNCDIFSNGQRGINAYSIGPENGEFEIKNCSIYMNWLGINIENVNSNRIENTAFYDNEKGGIRLFESDGNTVSGNTIHDNSHGMDMIDSSSSGISGNTLWKNTVGICLSGSHGISMEGNIFNESDTGLSAIDSDGNITGCAFYDNVNGTSIRDSTMGMNNCSFTNNTYGVYSYSSVPAIGGCEFTDNEYGLFLQDSDNAGISNCNGGNNTYGVFVNSSSHTGIENCSIFENSYGIFIQDSSNGSVEDCTLYNNTNGISVVNSSSNTISNSLIHHNMHGVWIKADGNEMFNCSLWKNVYGTSMDGGTANRVYHNNFAYNVENAIDRGNNNSWDNGYPSGGNYWSDYAGLDNYNGEGQNVSGSDGIGDIPYSISGGGNDDYPLMDMYTGAANIPNSPPTALFSYYPANPFSYDTVKFIDHSTDPNGEVDIVSWQWIFGDGNTSTVQNPEHEYNHSGVYNVSLTVRDGSGEDVTYTVSVEVMNLEPAANFSYTPSSPKTSDTIQFVDGSSDRDGTITNYTWDFGDGTDSHEKNPEHKYHDNGIYVVTLTVTDNEGAKTVITKKVTVANAPPSAEFFIIPEKASAGEKINFTDGSSDDGEIVAWHWDFGDGTASDKQNPRHAYEKSGKYTVTLTVRDNDGGESTTTKVIEITNQSTPGFGIIAMIAGVLLAVALAGIRKRKI